MINNFQDLFQKYNQKINIQKDIEQKILILIKDISNLSLTKDNLKIDQKNKIIKILNLTSSQKFFLIQKINEYKILEKIKIEYGFKLVI